MHAVQPKSDGEFKRVDHGPNYCSRIRSLREIFTALEPYGVNDQADSFKWFHHRSEREEFQLNFWEAYPEEDPDEHLPRHLLFEPQSVRRSLDLLLETAQRNGLTNTQRFYGFEIQQVNGAIFTSSLLSLATNQQIWHLEAGLEFCMCRTSNPRQEKNLLLTRAPGQQLFEGYVFGNSGPEPHRTREEAQLLAKSSAPTEQIFLTVEQQPNDLSLHIKLLCEVCDFATENGFLLDVIHSY